MNYFAHGVAFLDRPYLLAGTATPDWLVAADRRVRLRSQQLRAWLNRPELSKSEAEGPIGQVALGILQHLADDAQFHRSCAFLELTGQLSQQAAQLCNGLNPAGSLGVPLLSLESPHGIAAGPRDSFTWWFVGHLLVEILLDAALIAKCPGRLDEFYRVLHLVDPSQVQEAVNRISSRRTVRLAPMIREFCRLRVLEDYLDDRKLLGRLNQVMRRVGLPELPQGLLELLPAARRQVAARTEDLLAGIPATLFFFDKGPACFNDG